MARRNGSERKKVQSMQAIVGDGMRTRAVFSVCCRCSESTTGVRPERIVSGGRPLHNNAGQETISDRDQEMQSGCIETTLLIVSGGAETNSRRCQKQYFAGRVVFIIILTAAIPLSSQSVYHRWQHAHSPSPRTWTSISAITTRTTSNK